MKMSDVFEGVTTVESDPLSEYARFPIFDRRGVVLAAWNERCAKHVSHAINNHDKLVEALEDLINDSEKYCNDLNSQWIMDQAKEALKQAKGGE